MEPRNLKKWLTVMAVVYLVFPRDLSPDFLGRGLGLLDDLLLIGLLTYFYRKHLRQHAARATRGVQAGATAGLSSSAISQRYFSTLFLDTISRHLWACNVTRQLLWLLLHC